MANRKNSLTKAERRRFVTAASVLIETRRHADSSSI